MPWKRSDVRKDRIAEEASECIIARMPSVNCPVCGLINPATADRCDCGYDFRGHDLITPGLSKKESSSSSSKLDAPDQSQEPQKNGNHSGTSKRYPIALVLGLALGSNAGGAVFPEGRWGWAIGGVIGAYVATLISSALTDSGVKRSRTFAITSLSLGLLSVPSGFLLFGLLPMMPPALVLLGNPSVSFDPGDSTFGFFMRGAGVYEWYTESAKNKDRQTHVKVYPTIIDGRKIPNSFVLCWEDYPLDAGPSGLVDFTDLIVRVDGIRAAVGDTGAR